jgi:hypothetical protein
MEMVQRLIGSSVTVRDVAIGIVQPSMGKRVFNVVVLLASVMLFDVVAIRIIGPFAPVAGLGVMFCLLQLFPDSIGARAVGVTDDSFVLVRFGGWLRRASLVSVVSLDAALVSDIGIRRVGVTLGPETVRMRRREIVRLGRLHGVIGYGITHT